MRRRIPSRLHGTDASATRTAALRRRRAGSLGPRASARRPTPGRAASVVLEAANRPPRRGPTSAAERACWCSTRHRGTRAASRLLFEWAQHPAFSWRKTRQRRAGAHMREAYAPGARRVRERSSFRPPPSSWPAAAWTATVLRGCEGADGDLLKLIPPCSARGSLRGADQIPKATVPVKARRSLIFRKATRGRVMLLAGHGRGPAHDPHRSHADRGHRGAPTVLGEMSLLLERNHTRVRAGADGLRAAPLSKTQFSRLRQSESLAAYKLLATCRRACARLSEWTTRSSNVAATSVPAAAPSRGADAFKQKLSRWT